MCLGRQLLFHLDRRELEDDPRLILAKEWIGRAARVEADDLVGLESGLKGTAKIAGLQVITAAIALEGLALRAGGAAVLLDRGYRHFEFRQFVREGGAAESDPKAMVFSELVEMFLELRVKPRHVFLIESHACVLPMLPIHDHSLF